MGKAENGLLKQVDRLQLNFCPVFFNSEIHRFYINKENLEGVEEIILLSESDVLTYQLTDSSVIDYAYHNGNQLGGRVIWSYSTNEIERTKNTKRKKLPSKKINKQERPVQPLFDNQTISMVGGGNLGLQHTIKNAVERRKGTFLFCTGDEPHDTIISKLRKSSCVIVYTESISHEAMYLTKDFCKQHQIPISFTKNIGSTLFVARVNKLLKFRNTKNESSKGRLQLS